MPSAQQAVRSSIYDDAPGFIAISTGPGHVITYTNPAYRTLVGDRPLVGLRVVEAMPELVDQGVIELLDGVFQTGVSFVGNAMPMMLCSGPNGEAKQYFITFVYQAIRGESGAIEGLFCEGFDVTAERAAAEKLSMLQVQVEHLSRLNAMGMMAATIAHELNQPLTAIAGFAAGSSRLLQSHNIENDALSSALRGIDEAAQRGAAIIRNVRELTKRGDTPKTTFDLATLIAESVRLIGAWEQSRPPIRDLTREPFLITADRTQIQQVIINLLRNAAQAIEGRREDIITIEATAADDTVVVAVTDSGPGLSNVAAHDLFTWTDTSKQSGMGLGLAISRSIVEAHRGRIWVAHSDGTGTQFRFSLPLPKPRKDGQNG